MQINPSLNNFVKLAKKNNLIVLSYKFYSDSLTPVSIYHNLSKQFKEESFLLESVEGEEKISRFSFMGFMPIAVFKSKGVKINIKEQAETAFETGKDPLFELKKFMHKFKVAPKENLRFFGGFVGYLGYDLVRFYEQIGGRKKESLNTPDTYLMLPKFLIIFDHLKKQIEILSFVKINPGQNLKSVYAKEVKIIEGIFKKLQNPAGLQILSMSGATKAHLKSNLSKKDFALMIEKAKKCIREGEIIQTVLSQRFSVDFSGDPFNVYRYLRILNPSPYMFYLNFKDLKVAGSSPEMLLRCEKGILTTRPIAGTRSRGKDELEEKKFEKSLLDDPKERAEHIMLVDLARNDLGRVAKSASVNVPVFMTIEHFSHVMHIVSETRACLKKGEDIFSAFISCFPAGTVSGAPKVRAMQIINELEGQERGIYAGSVGYFSFTNSLDTCIIIRTIIFKNETAYIQAGAGIVMDSKPEKEYKETLNKARAQVLAVKLAKGLD
ncbi:MAG: anthranilate synthase component I [Candidatus Omnitrophica bacterium]|jgi:anthranilate synthase component 1|nr:anthranilate synthase component I [Candidatus Omnitrophota bacterium]